METVLKAENIHKTYEMSKKTVHVLKGASLDIEGGCTTAIVGVSGAGKSTLLHILGALDEPDEGRVSFRGQDLYGISDRGRTMIRSNQIGFVFQSYHLLPEMDVLENVMLPSMAR